MSWLYWVLDDTCKSVYTDGYVGVSESPPRRLYDLHRRGRVPAATRQVILFEGTREQCLAKEAELRPGRNSDTTKILGEGRPSALGYIPANRPRLLLGRPF
jgi:hypothetical protein